MVLFIVFALLPLALLLYAYLVYPALLWLVTRFARSARPPALTEDWPHVTITVPVYNAVGAIATTIERLLDIDYPKERLQILVVSDASSDGTDEVVAGFAPRGVQLLRMPARLGKTAAENAAVSVAQGELIVNVDATILVPRTSLKPLVRAFADPSVGVASGRDVSLGETAVEGTQAESGYVGYEMWLRTLETKVGSIVGASGCFYGFRRSIHEQPLPEELSWDFASALVAAEQGFRAVSVVDAICVVPRTIALRTELSRKTRTMARGLSTLFHKRRLMNPLRYGAFAFMLISHKLARWLPYLTLPLALLSLGVLATRSRVALLFLVLVLLGIVCGGVGIRWPRTKPVPKLFALAGFVLAAFIAGFLAWVDALRKKRTPTWEPTPRVTTPLGTPTR
jgi:cellulose synthase/poly-beta-1,6-N-acetylglucosamine synthase-like glycosyltransferase